MRLAKEKKKENKNPWNINANACVPKKSTKEGTSVENEDNDDKNNETSGDCCSVKKSAIGESNDSDGDESVDDNRIAEVNVKERNQCSFEMTCDIVNAMKKWKTQSLIVIQIQTNLKN